MTLAPRSWPSRPGFATTTRILSIIALVAAPYRVCIRSAHSKSRFLICAVDGTQFIADLTERCIGTDAVQDARHHIETVVCRSFPQCFESCAHPCIVARLTQFPKLFDLPPGNGFIDEQYVDRRFVFH